VKFRAAEFTELGGDASPIDMHEDSSAYKIVEWSIGV
jgi:hypothetical protein